MADQKTTPWTEAELDDATRRLEAATKAAAPTPLNPTPWLSDAPKGSPKPEPPQCQGGLWYHQQQAIETTHQSVGKARAWAAREAASSAAWAAEMKAKADAKWAATVAEEQAKESARRAAREAQEAALAARIAALEAANKRAAREAAREAARMALKRAALGAAIKAGKEAARAANPHTPEQPDTKVAKYRPDIRHQMDVREVVAGVMRRDTPRQQSALDRAALLCNRLIENLFPQKNFSDMALVPVCGKDSKFDYGSNYEREDNDE